MEAISDTQIQAYAHSVPESWTDGRKIAGEILSYLLELKNNIVPALAAIRNSLQ